MWPQRAPLFCFPQLPLGGGTPDEDDDNVEKYVYVFIPTVCRKVAVHVHQKQCCKFQAVLIWSLHKSALLDKWGCIVRL